MNPLDQTTSEIVSIIDRYDATLKVEFKQFLL
jgi:hypothetical protein